MLSQPDKQYADDTDGGHHMWYSDDLQLAAELGKALLERNVDLEAQLHSLQQTSSEQESEITLLRRQLETLRAIDESRSRACEEVDRNAHELEKANAKLQRERQTDADTIRSLKESVVRLEERTEALESAVVAERARANDRERGRRREVRRARSVPSRDPNTPPTEFRGLPSPGAGHDAVVAGLRLRLEVQRGRCRRAEDDLAAVVVENRELGAQLRHVIASTSHQTVETLDMETNQQQVESSIEAVCVECKKRISAPQPFSEPYEHDLEELPSGSGKLVRLKNGGSAFGSRDSLYRIGLEPDDTTPGREVCSAILAASFQSSQTTSALESTTASGGGSLLAELEEQYRRLVIRYESLIEAKTANANHSDAAKADRAGAGRPQDLNLPSSDPTEGHFDKGPPEYKRLFSEIFKTLRRSADYPPVTSPQPKDD